MTEELKALKQQVADITEKLKQAARLHSKATLYVTEEFEILLKLVRDGWGGYLYEAKGPSGNPPTFTGVPVHEILVDRLDCYPQEKPYRVVVEL